MIVLSAQPPPARPAYEVAVVDVHGDRVSIRATGQLELAASEDLSRLLEAQLAAGHVFVRMDLSAVTSVDGSCLGTLKHAHEDCLASQGLLLLEGVREATSAVFEAIGLDRQLFLTRTTGPPKWLPDLPRLAELVGRNGWG